MILEYLKSFISVEEQTNNIIVEVINRVDLLNSFTQIVGNNIAIIDIKSVPSIISYKVIETELKNRRLHNKANYIICIDESNIKNENFLEISLTIFDIKTRYHYSLVENNVLNENCVDIIMNFIKNSVK